jgi:formylglycine-generating enzyme required for sulfatase activity
MNILKHAALLAGILLCLSFTGKEHGLIPPGTVEVNDTLFFDKVEVSNLAWLEYVNWNIKTFGPGTEQHKNVLPDTTVWRANPGFNEPYVIYYFRHPAYKNYPVVGISFEQATEYCRWRTKMVNELYLKKKDAITSPTKFEYRLPSKSEWEAVAILGYSEKAKKQIEKRHQKVNGNFRDTASLANTLYDNAYATAPTKSYFENKLGIYNLIGNVAEMLDQKGICKGGSWRHLPEDCGFDKDFLYEKPNAWTGFRCVCVRR